MNKTVRLVMFGMQRLLVVAALCVPGFAQQASPPAPAAIDELAKAREKVHAIEAAHPGNSAELAAAIDDLIQKQLDGEFVNAETLTLAMREAEIDKTVFGPKSKAYATVLGMISEVYIALSRAAEGRPFAEQGLAIAEKEFPGTEDFANAEDELAFVCGKLGDNTCAIQAQETAIAVIRKVDGNNSPNLINELTNLADYKIHTHDMAGAGAASEESLAIELKTQPNDPHLGVLENNLGSFYVQNGEFQKAIPHLTHAIEVNARLFGPDSPMVRDTRSNLGNLYSRTGQFDLAWKNFELSLANPNATVDSQAHDHALFARSLASGGDLPRAIAEGLVAGKLGRESFVLQARTLPERQALAYAAQRPRGVDTAISVLLRHPEMPVADTYQEVVRSRALVADEMARRQKNLNASNSPEIAHLLADLNQARADLLAGERAAPAGHSHAEAVTEATARMEKIERALAERSAALRSDERIAAVRLEDLRQALPPQSILISYVLFSRRVVGAVDAAHTDSFGYMAFVIRPDSPLIRIFDLGDEVTLNDLVRKIRATADAEAHSGGLGSIRNERAYREAAESLRKLIWDPLQSEMKDAKLALVVPDGLLNLIPFSALPQGTGYLVEHGPVIHTISSERDLVPAGAAEKKAGLLAVGSPQFELAGLAPDPSPLRDGPANCADWTGLAFHDLPGSKAEVADLASSWQRWNGAEPSALLTGSDATRTRFIQQAGQNRMLHVATHAFLLDRSCGNGNPLLRSGLVFAGANQNRDASILTAQQIASIDLSGVDWAVLSACNTGNGELHDGEGVLGLQRAFRVAGAHSVIMTLWPVDDDVTRQFMHELYSQRLGQHATTADAVWNSARKLLLDRRAAGKSTNPWYWAGFVGTGAWQ